MSEPENLPAKAAKAKVPAPRERTLNDNQQKGAELIAAGFSTREVADRVKVKQETVRLWRRENPLFRQTVDRLLLEKLQSQKRGAVYLLDDAYVAMQAILADPNARHADKIAVFKILVDIVGAKDLDASESAKGAEPLKPRVPELTPGSVVVPVVDVTAVWQEKLRVEEQNRRLAEESRIVLQGEIVDDDENDSDDDSEDEVA